MRDEASQWRSDDTKTAGSLSSSSIDLTHAGLSDEDWPQYVDYHRKVSLVQLATERPNKSALLDEICSLLDSEG